MKTALDLPVDLVREIKPSAVHEGSKLKDTIAEMLRKGLRDRTAKNNAKVSRVKLPLVHCRRSATLTPDKVVAALLKQEAEWHHDAPDTIHHSRELAQSVETGQTLPRIL
ncbi:MAG: hypothetical protein Q8M07_06390 [Prosthecobacter sp.]|nr:hypothetical protein [Prosthecobacter sp.]